MKGFSIGRSGTRSALQRSRLFRRFGAVGTATLLVASSMFVFTAGSVVLAATTSNNGDATCGYPTTTSTQFPAGATTFNESTVLRNVGVVGKGTDAKIVAYANDEKGLLLGVAIAGTSPNGTPVGGTPTKWSNGTVTTSTTLSAALVQNVATTTLNVAALLSAVAVNDLLSLTTAGHTQTNIKVTAAAGGGATTLTVVSFKPNAAYPIGTAVLDTTQASGGPVYGHAISPDVGNKAATDASITGGTASRPQYPALYITNITQDPLVNGHGVGDWQAVNGQPQSANQHINDIFGTWLTATITNGTYALDTPLPPSNGWTLGASAGGGTNYDDPSTVAFAAGPTTFAAFGNEGYGTELRWNANTLVDSHGIALAAGNKYRIQVINHDGDQNKSGGDTGEYCTTLTIPGQPVINTAPNGGTVAAIKVPVGTSISDTANLTGSASFGPVTGSVVFHLYFVPAGVTTTTPCVSGNEVTGGTTGFPSTVTLTPGSASTTPPWTSTATSASFLNSALGTYYFEDFYSGDANYLPLTETCGIQTVTTVDAHVLLTPHAADNEVGHVHTLTARVETTLLGTTNTNGTYTDGTAVNGAVVNFTIPTNPGTSAYFTNAAGSANNGVTASCTTTASGTCDVYLVDNTVAGVSVHAATNTFTQTGVVGTFSSRQTNGAGNNSDATKNFVDASIALNPLASTNEVGNAHTFTVTVTAIPASATPVTFGTITPSVSPTPDLQNATTCGTPTVVSATVETCTITINSDTAGVFTINASAGVTMGSVTVTRSTSGNSGPGGTGSATKRFVDASVGISPLTATNLVGNPHVFTITVTAIPAGATPVTFGAITPSVLPTPDLQNDTTCGTPTVVSATVETCTITINSSTVGTFTANATAVVTMGGVAVTRSTDSSVAVSGPGGTGPATKIYINPKTILTVADTLTGIPAGNNGTVVYKVFDNNTCNDPTGPTGLLTTSSKTVTDGTAQSSSTFDVNPGDTVWFTATYTGISGGLNGQTFTTSCSAETASSAP